VSETSRSARIKRNLVLCDRAAAGRDDTAALLFKVRIAAPATFQVTN
jgi:hypothetical protein